MISVIILSRNFKYVVLDVPQNGKLIIREKHIIAGMVQNGVKVVPYGAVLNPFESYISGETLSAELIPHSAFMDEGRILDFTIIELLQLSTTIALTSSGSVGGFVAPTYTVGGAPIEYNLMVRGMGLTLESAKSIFTGYDKLAVDCNSVANLNDGYQKLSLLSPKTIFKHDIRNNSLITEFYDLTGFIKSTSSYTLDSVSNLEIVVLPGLTSWSGFTIYQGQPSKLKLLKLPSLPFFGVDAAGVDSFPVGGGFNKLPVGVTFEVPRSMETVNAGALDADLQNLITNLKYPVIKYID